MAQEDQDLFRSLVRSIDKKLEWEAIAAQDHAMRLTLRLSHGESTMDVTRVEIANALDNAMGRNRLRERIKRARQRVFDRRRPYMPWKLPKIESIGAPGPRSGWGGGGGGGRR
jgi:hypothetical protein